MGATAKKCPGCGMKMPMPKMPGKANVAKAKKPMPKTPMGKGASWSDHDYSD